jgi:NAD(P)-dependent dehydrogenase (short-subunit alcohol dehydrogenase family)
MQTLNNKVAIVSGADRGIGRAMANRLHAQGVKLMLCSNNREGLMRTADQEKWTGSSVLLDVFDVASPEAVADFVARGKREFGRIDYLFNVAGVLYFGGILKCTIEQWDRTINTNLKGYFLMAREVLPIMKDSGGGAIVNISSIWGKRGNPVTFAYAVSKFGVEGLTKCLQEEVKGWGVKVSSIVLDKVDTDFRENFAGHLEYTEEQKARMITAEDVVDSAMYIVQSSSRVLPASIDLDAWMWK